MRDGPRPDPLEEGLALAALEAELFERRPTVPVLARYVLLGKLGQGGLGVVFRAYDPDLDRRVALKLVRLRPGQGDPETSLLLREARMMARLTHPNVVTVHDVGVYTERDLGQVADHADLGIPPRGVFLVMELLERGSLRDVLRESAPPPRRLLSMVLAAGRGIAAAHAHGIVHRDFKPANVLVGADGEVRVADFGLARSAAEPDDERGGGTPAYMAPEQLHGGTADAQSDQYAFALTCWVALYGEHPFAAQGRRVRGPLPPAPKRRGVPRGVHKVLRRALSLDPSRRFPDMPAMLRALESARADRPRRTALAVGGGLVVTLGILVGRVPASEPVCRSAGSAIDEVWNDGVRHELRAAFLASGQPFAEGSWASVQRTLDAYAEQWRTAARAACEDTHVRHVQSEAQLDLRGACLERHRRELGAAVRLLGQADPAMLANAVQLAHGLGWIAACEDAEAVASERRLPEDPDLRAAVTAVAATLGEARLLELSGRYAEATVLAERGRARAEALGDEPLLAAADLRLGSVAASRGDYRQSRGLLLRGIQAAEGARQDELAADGWIRLLWVAGVELEDTEQGDLWVGFARAALRRLGDDPLREAELVHNLGGLYYRRARWDEALAHYERALTAQRARLGEASPDVARTLNHMANVLLMSGEPRRSLTYSRRSLELRRELLGPQHPLVAASLNNVAAAHLQLRAWGEARHAIDQALAITAGRGLPEEAVARGLAAQLAAEEASDGR
jgi:eukaryotic-like serine/threonine-protein kinase